MRRLPLALVPLLFSGCLAFLGPADNEGNIRDLVAARARWNTFGLTDYDVVARSVCFCGHDGDRYRYSVRGNAVTSVVRVSTGETVQHMTWSVTADPVEWAFHLVENAVNLEAARLDVEFHDIWGFPRKLNIDFREGTADDEFQIWIESFQPISR